MKTSRVKSIEGKSIKMKSLLQRVAHVGLCGSGWQSRRRSSLGKPQSWLHRWVNEAAIGTLTLAAGVAGCSGDVGAESEPETPEVSEDSLGPNVPGLSEPVDGDVPAANTRDCSAGGATLTPQLRRLSETQIQNSVVDIFGDIFSEDAWPNFEDGARLIGMNTLADKLQVNSLNLERHYDATRGIVATLLTEHPEFQSCVAEAQPDCVSELTRDYGRRVWRRPLTSEEQGRFDSELNAFDDNAARLEFVFNVLLVSSEFLFRSETGAAAGEAGVRLNNFELVSFLSYATWNSTPDDVLLDLATQGEPLTAQQLEGELDRMLEDPRATIALVDLYADFLKLDLVLERDKDESFGLTGPVRAELLASAELMLSAGISEQGPMMSVFGGREFFVSEATAPFFNQPTATPELAPVEIDSTERSGLLNHPAFLTVHSTRSSSGIVKRGVFALEQLLCQHLPDPPADISTLEPPQDLDPDTTSERELLMATHSAQPSCIGCHQFIDPAGFGFEHFDAAGRYRTTEKQNVEIDASGQLDGVGSYQTSADFSRALVGSERMKDCVTRRFLEHYVGQELEADSCSTERFASLLAEQDDTTFGLLRALVQLPSFSSRALMEDSQ